MWPGLLAWPQSLGPLKVVKKPFEGCEETKDTTEELLANVELWDAVSQTNELRMSEP